METGRLRGAAAILGLLATLLVACASSAAPSGQRQPTAAPAEAPPTAPQAAQSAAVGTNTLPKDLLEAANREGQVQIYWSATGTDEWRQRFQDGMNQEYGTNISVVATQADNWNPDIAKLITQVKAGQKPTWDIMMVTDAHYQLLADAGLLGKYPWTEQYGVPAKAVMFDGGAYAFAHQAALPAYNPTLVQAADVPKTWDDLLDSKWQGKIGVPSSTHHWARLSELWGDDKTTAFVQKLSTLNPKLGSLADVSQRMQLGEVRVLTTVVSDFIKQAESTGAPVKWATDVQPVILTSMMAGPLKDGPHPNAGVVFSLFLSTPKGQALWDQLQGQSSIFVEGSSMSKFVQGKQYVFTSEEFLRTQLQARASKYGKLIGYR